MTRWPSVINIFVLSIWEGESHFLQKFYFVHANSSIDLYVTINTVFNLGPP